MSAAGESILSVGHAAGITVIENIPWAVCTPGEQLSVAPIVIPEYVPAVVGVPDIRPVGPSVNPGGNVPLIRLNETDATPPDV